MATLTKAQQAGRAEAIESLRDMLPAGAEVYTILRHVSRSGMLRHIDVVVIRDGDARNISGLVAQACDYKRADDGSLKVHGCGMDMGSSVVYNLSRTLFADDHPFYCNGDAGPTYAGGCPSNDHVNERGGLGDYSPTRVHSDGGYALSQRWL